MCSWNLPYLSFSLRGRRDEAIQYCLLRGLDCFATPAMTVSKLRSTYALNLSACNRDSLSRDRAGSFAAQPKHGIGDFRRGHKPALRIMPGEFGHRLLAAAASFFHDVVDT